METDNIDTYYRNALKSKQCKILVPYAKAKSMSWEEAVDLAMRTTYSDRTQGTGKEVHFDYDAKDRSILSPIVLGTQCFVSVVRVNKSQDMGSFHTHPKHGLCFFSEPDIKTAYATNESVVALGCPANEMVIELPLALKPKADFMQWFTQTGKQLQKIAQQSMFRLAMQGKTNLTEASNDELNAFVQKEIVAFGGNVTKWKLEK